MDHVIQKSCKENILSSNVIKFGRSGKSTNPETMFESSQFFNSNAMSCPQLNYFMNTTNMLTHNDGHLHDNISNNHDYLPFNTNNYEINSINPNKPPYSYITLISLAIRSSREEKLTLSGIYEWIRKNFAYFRLDSQKWQNSIRHALSFNDCFIKLARPIGESGKGCYWIIHPDARDHFQFGSLLRRYKKFTQSDKKHIEITRYSQPIQFQSSSNIRKDFLLPIVRNG